MAPTKSLKAAVKYSVKAIARKPKGGPPRREWSRAWLIFRLKLAQNRNALLVTLAFWALGFAYYWQAECPAAGGRHVLLVSLGVREPLSRTDVSGFYQMTWPIFLEVIFFGFILAAFVERYSPVRLGRIQARRLAEHTVVVGYGHLGQRMVDHLQHAGKPFVVVDRTEATVGDLLSAEEAVVLGSPTERSTFEAANVMACKEVFLLMNNLKEAIIACHHVRALHATCALYVQLFEHYEFEEYLSQPPFRATTFSTSLWAVESLDEWTDPAKFATAAPPSEPTPGRHRPRRAQQLGDMVILGSGHCAQRFARYLIMHRRGHTVYVVDDGISKQFLSSDPNGPLFSAPSAPPATASSVLTPPAPDGPVGPATAGSDASLGTLPTLDSAPLGHVAAGLSGVASTSDDESAVPRARMTRTQSLVPLPALRRFRAAATAIDAARRAALHRARDDDMSTDDGGQLSSALPRSSSASSTLLLRRPLLRNTSNLSAISTASITNVDSPVDATGHEGGGGPQPDWDVIRLVSCLTNRLHHIEAHVDLGKVSHVFMCWSDVSSTTSNAIYLAMQLQTHYPHIHVFVRTFDDEVRVVLESLGATTFSTSLYAFEMLQARVAPTSNISVASSRTGLIKPKLH